MVTGRKFLFIFHFLFFIFYFSFCNFVYADGQSIWTSDGAAISVASNHQKYPQIISDCSYGAIICWQDYRSNIEWDIYAQAIKPGGTVKWALNGVSVSAASNDQLKPAMVSDGKGGAIIAWWDKRNGTSYNIYSQRLDSSGNVQWTTDGVAISTITNITSDMVEKEPRFNAYRFGICSDGSEGAIICWIDKRNGNLDIYAQRISKAGAVQWSENGIIICENPDIQNYPVIISDENKGAIIAWHDRRNDNIDIYAKRISSEGVTVWEEKKVFSNTHGDKAGIFNPAVDMTGDGAGDALLCWQQRDSNDLYDIYAQRISGTDGSKVWVADGAIVCGAGDHQMEPVIAKSNEAGTAVVAWRDFRVESYTDSSPKGNVYCERLNSDGLRSWKPGTNGLTVCNKDYAQEHIKIIPEETGGAIISWQDSRSGIDIYAQKYNLDILTLPWGQETEYSGTAVCAYTQTQQFPVIIDDGIKGAIICWQDERAAVGDIYAQRICDPDEKDPEAITTLSALTGSGADEITLTWLAPHEDGTLGGKVSYYILKYSTSDPTGNESIWWNNLSNAYKQSWQPMTPGEKEQKNVYLLSSTSYYFILRAVDDANNISALGLSNIADAVSAVDNISPSKILDLTAETGITEGIIDLTWSTPLDNAGSPENDIIITGNYYIQLSHGQRRTLKCRFPLKMKNLKQTKVPRSSIYPPEQPIISVYGQRTKFQSSRRFLSEPPHGRRLM